MMPGDVNIVSVPVVALEDYCKYVKTRGKGLVMGNCVSVSVAAGCIAFKVVGDSMVAEGESISYPDGAIVIADPAKKAVSGNRVVVDIPGQGVTFKELVIDAGARYLKPLNKRYPIYGIPDDAKIIAVAVQSISTE